MPSNGDITALVKAVNHPLRCRIVNLFNETGEASSPKMISEMLDEPLGDVSYHVRVLEKYEAIELINTEPARGAVEHFYVRTDLVIRNLALVEQLVAE